MNKSFLVLGILFVLAGCSASQFAMYRPKNSEKQWNISAERSALGSTISVSVNDSVVVSESPGVFSYSFEAKGMYEGHEIKFHAVYNDGFLGIGSGWETTVFVDNELAARFKL